VALVAKGSGATLAQVPDGTAAGGNKRGTYATDLQKNRASANQVAEGYYSVIAGGVNNRATTYGSIACGGESNLASGGTYASVFGGRSNTAYGQLSFIGCGESNYASGQWSVVCGGTYNEATARASFVSGGVYGTTRSIEGYHVFPACNAPIANGAGINQSGLLLLGRQTTDATATVLGSNTSAAGTTNQVILPNNSAYSFSGEVIAGVTGAGNTARWTISGAIKRGATAASTAVVGSVVLNVIAADAGASAWTVAITADTTNGGIAVTVTGAAATTIRWVAKIETTEMTY